MTGQPDQPAGADTWYFAQMRAARRMADSIDLDATITARLSLVNCGEPSHSRTFGFILRNASERVEDYLADTERDCSIAYLRLLYCVRARLRAAACIRGQTYCTPRSTALEYDSASACL